jgi:hypothetical protein
MYGIPDLGRGMKEASAMEGDADSDKRINRALTYGARVLRSIGRCCDQLYE